MEPAVILGAGLAGLSVSYHLGHARCLLLEARAHAFGHIHSVLCDGLTWDEGPHVSFTKSDYVRELFARSVAGEFEEFDTRIGNYYRGHWIEHPAQVHLHQVPQPLRDECLASFLASRDDAGSPAANYQEWLQRAFGPVFARTFPAAYTRKYWRREPREMTTDWVGGRILQPDIQDVIAGARGALGRKMNYITRVRYPRRGGYESFARHLREGARIRFGTAVTRIDLKARQITLEDGTTVEYGRLVSTIPLPEFVRCCADVPAEVVDAAKALSCTELVIVNIAVPRPAERPETWFYVYDEDKLSTRVNFTEHLSPANAPAGWSGIQVEVYSDRGLTRSADHAKIAARVQAEVREMGLMGDEPARVHIVPVPWANVIFDRATAPALATVWRWLEQFGLARECDDLHPLTDWSRPGGVVPGPLAFAGRYGQWKYFWTDDCVLRGKALAEVA